MAQFTILHADSSPTQLAMGVLGSVFAGTYAMAGGSKKNLTQQGPPINAKSKDEEDFIQ